MQQIPLKQIANPHSHTFDLVIDASEGRLTSDLYIFKVQCLDKPALVLLKAIGIGVSPGSWLIDDMVVVQANSGIWLLRADAKAFEEIKLGYPLYGVSQTSRGLLAFHLLGCELISLSSGDVLWRHLGGELLDFSVAGDDVTLMFENGGVHLDLFDGSIRARGVSG